MKRKANCLFCGNRRTEKDYIQQSTCKLNLNPKECNKFIDANELRKYKEIMNNE